MKTRLLLASLATATAMSFALPAFAADSAQDFVDKAAAGGIFEVDSSKIAEQKAQGKTVKEFAQKMIDDHGAANAKLETIAGAEKLKLPTELDAKHKSDLDTLKNTKDPLDASYVEMQLGAHSKAVTLFESYAKDGDNAQLKIFAQETVPTLKMHQEMIEKIASTFAEKPADATSTTPAVTTTESPNATALVPGANSFTEDQAKGRIQDAGFTDVTKLTKDGKGIWRGLANKGGNIPVALDFQGNVVAGTN